MMTLCLMFATFHAQDVDQDYTCQQDDSFDQVAIDLAFQELIYDMGICLAGQDLIVDNQSAKDAFINVYNQIEQVNQIIDLFMIIDEELVEQEITTIEDLIDYEIAVEDNVAQSCIAWLAAYQKVFIIFLQIHGSDASFVDWCQDVIFMSELEDGQELDNLDYFALWQASLDVMKAQKEFEAALQA